jgi:hypothetical protein
MASSDDRPICPHSLQVFRLGWSQNFSEEHLNDTSYNLLQKSERWSSEQSLKNARTKLRCMSHGVQRVIDYNPEALDERTKGTVTLECGCHRSLFSSDAISSYEDEKTKRVGQRRTGWNGGSVISVEDVGRTT